MTNTTQAQGEAMHTPAAAFDIVGEVAAGRALIAEMSDVLDFALIGSALYLPDAKDVDFAVRIKPELNAVNYTTQMNHDGWGSCGEYDGTGGTWAAIRRGNLNLMVTHDFEFYERYVTAMEVCKALGLRNKHERVAVCQIVRDGKTADEAHSYWSAIQKAETTASHAAPQLLEALRRLCKSAPTDTNLIEAGLPQRDVDAFCNAYDDARAAIASATGRDGA